MDLHSQMRPLSEILGGRHFIDLVHPLFCCDSLFYRGCSPPQNHFSTIKWCPPCSAPNSQGDYIYTYVYIADRVLNTCYVRDGAALNVRITGIKKQRVNISRLFWIILRRWQGVRPLLRKTCIQWPVLFWVMATHSDVCVFSTYVHCF